MCVCVPVPGFASASASSAAAPAAPSGSRIVGVDAPDRGSRISSRQLVLSSVDVLSSVE